MAELVLYYINFLKVFDKIINYACVFYIFSFINNYEISYFINQLKFKKGDPVYQVRRYSDQWYRSGRYQTESESKMRSDSLSLFLTRQSCVSAIKLKTESFDNGLQTQLYHVRSAVTLVQITYLCAYSRITLANVPGWENNWTWDNSTFASTKELTRNEKSRTENE